jgi:hypothetical protein
MYIADFMLASIFTLFFQFSAPVKIRQGSGFALKSDRALPSKTKNGRERE